MLRPCDEALFTADNPVAMILQWTTAEDQNLSYQIKTKRKRNEKSVDITIQRL